MFCENYECRNARGHCSNHVTCHVNQGHVRETIQNVFALTGERADIENLWTVSSSLKLEG